MPNRFDYDAIRARLDSRSGPELWRGLEELAETDDFQELLHREFSEGASELLDPVSRRRFLHLMGGSLALAGLAGCTRQPRETIVPYVNQPEQIIPGKPLYFATAMTMRGIATGILVESHMGRPTKVEGNPDHPGSRGATDVFGQGWVLDLYDPDRSQVVTHLGRIRPWGNFVQATRGALAGQHPKKGTGLRILTETVTSPTIARQMKRLLAAFPEAKWIQYEPAGRDNVRAGAQLAFGADVEPQYRFEKASVILSLDADFLFSLPGGVRYARDFASARRVRGDKAEMNRLYVAESSISVTGSVADHRWPMPPSAIESFARAVAKELGVGAGSTASVVDAKTLQTIAKDLRTHRGRGLVVAGEEQPPIVHVLAHAMNHALGNVGETLVYTDPVETGPASQIDALRELGAEMEAGKVEVLLILGGNPVFTAPADLEFAKRLDKVPLRIHLGLYEDETSELCHWHVNEAHPLETWNDARACDGTVTILQPLIEPLYNGRSIHELVAAVRGAEETTAYDLVRETWKDEAGGDFERFWRRSLNDGVIAGSARPPRSVSLRSEAVSAPAAPRKGGGLEIVFRTDPTIFDGRFANNGWLQELPKPLTKLSWDNAAIVSPMAAEKLGVGSGEIVVLAYEGRSVEAPIWIQPGHPDGCVTVHLGYGRTRSGKAGTGAGFDAYRLRTSGAPWSGAGLEIRKTAKTATLAASSLHYSMEGRPLARAGTLEEFAKHPDFAEHHHPDPPKDLTLYAPHPYPGYAWGMSIDLGSCIGCQACVIACQAENNISVVGKDQVIRGRGMHWIRVDRYFKGGLENPEVIHQPVPCQHCENAPCEVVCPVGATNHSSEGLNDMIYNRCVGTRYCSNNCPYKVRRFNFYLYSDWTTESLKGVRNPDVTVRSRGVMEKCTYCVQRINAAKIEAEKEDRKVRDGEIRTACQQVCPTEAITFGDVNDAASQVAKLKAGPRDYSLLGELNTRPRTTYLARVTNPNPEIAVPKAGEG